MSSPRSLCGLLLTSLGLVACSQSQPAPIPVDPSVALFDPEHVVEVSIDMAPADWDTLRLQSRSVMDILGGSCLAAPFPSPFTYFLATVTIDGQRLANVGVRKKGFLGSLDVNRPSLKINFDEYVPGLEMFGLDKLTLNNSKQDPSFLHQCLAYATFARAGIAAPRCNFAHVTVNGADLGLYVHVESVERRFLRRHFDDDTGNLYEGTLSDFRAEWVNTFEKKTNETNPDRSDLDAVVAALGAPDATVLDALGPVVDVEQFLTYWATEVLISHWDGYANNTNNFFLYHDPTSGRFQFLPWGTDGIMQTDQLTSAMRPLSVFAVGALARRLYLLPATQQRYLDRLQTLLDTVWDETALFAEIDRMEALITPVGDPGRTGRLAVAIEGVRTFVRTHRADLLNELAAGPPAWTEALRDPPCLTVVGDLQATFSTTFGTVGAMNPFATGTGTVVATINMVPIAITAVGATSGFNTDPANPGVVVNVIAALTDGTYAVAAVLVGTSRFVAGNVIPIDFGSAFGGVWHFDPATTTPTLVGFILNGTLRLDQAALTPGAPVAGSLQGDIVRIGP